MKSFKFSYFVSLTAVLFNLSLGYDLSKYYYSRSTHSSYSRERFVEVMIAVDRTMNSFYGDYLETYLNTLITGVASIYFDKSLGNSIEVVLKRVLVLDSEIDNRIKNEYSSNKLAYFCDWQVSKNYLDNDNHYDYDVAIYLSRNLICDTEHCNYLGLAYSGQVCIKDRSCIIARDTGLNTIPTIAHEIGHILSMAHDDDDENSNCYLSQAEKELYLMYSGIGIFDPPWSKCSKATITKFFNEGYGECLLNRPENYKKLSTRNLLLKSELPGKIFGRDAQCKLISGKYSYECSQYKNCKNIYCVNPYGTCIAYTFNLADGTDCGDDKWCFRGSCVKKFTIKSRSRNGKWGKWSAWSPCSRDCGGGIKYATRDCIKPSSIDYFEFSPREFGKYCTGLRVKYRSCNTHACPRHRRSFRFEQCSDFNEKPAELYGETVPENVKWQPIYHSETSEKNPCVLSCSFDGGKYMHDLSEKVVDGTRCYPNSLDVCVAGECKHVGCDRKIGSKLEFDHCGVCGGINTTCVKKSQMFKFRHFRHGHNMLFAIPVGATNLSIKKSALNKSKFNLYLTLSTEDNKFHLNDGEPYNEGIYPLYDNGFYYGGHNNGTNEYIRFKLPLEEVLFVGILSYDQNIDETIKVRYTYYISQ